MLAGGIGPLSSLVVLVILPIAGGFLLPTREFAVWAILNSVSSVALGIDFGGTAYVAVNANKVKNPWRIVVRGFLISSLGTALVCGICMVAWIPYSTTAAAGGWSIGEGELALVVILIASSLRGVSTVFASAALARIDYRSRNILLLGQALLVAIITVALILVTSSAWALPLGWLFGTGVSLLIVWPRIVRDYRREMVTSEQDGIPVLVSTAREFTVKRTIASLLGSFLLQGDRWVIGVAAGPAFLAAYELAWRFASAPRLVAMSITAVLTPDAKAAAQASRLGELVRHSSRVLAVVNVIVALFASAAIITLHLIGKIDSEMVGLGLVVVVSLTINGRTSITTTTGIGVGRVGVDIPYLSWTAGLTALVWVIAVIVSSGIFLVIGEAAVLSLLSLVFVLRVERRMVLAQKTA
jgi:O-antigen/teichoic acid export membrane protein